MATSVAAVKRGDVSSVLPMFYKKARATWNQLRPKTRSFVSVEDLVSDSIALTIGPVVKGYDSKKAKFTTYLFKALDNNNINTLVYYSAKERDERKTLSYDSDFVYANGALFPVDYYVQKTKKVSSPEQLVINRIDTERAFLNTYRAATPLLRKYLIRWLLNSTTTKFKDGAAYRAARKEFKYIRQLHKLTYPLCTFLTQNEQIRVELSYKILFVHRFRTPRKPKYEQILFLNVLSKAEALSRCCVERSLIRQAMKYLPAKPVKVKKLRNV